MAKVAQLAGNVPKAARRLGVRVSKLHTGDNYVQANARRIGFERETAIEAGFAPPEPIEIFPSLVFRRIHSSPGLFNQRCRCWLRGNTPFTAGCLSQFHGDLVG